MKSIVIPWQRKIPLLMLALLCLLAVMIIFSPAADAAENEDTVLVFTIGSSIYTVNGAPQIMDVSPAIIEDRTLLPIRFAATPLGAEVGWENETRKATVLLGTTFMELWIGQSNAMINGNVVPIDVGNPNVKPLIISDRTMLPLRFVTENLGCEVQWEQATQRVTIIKTGSATDAGKIPGISVDPGKISDVKQPGIDPGDIKLSDETSDSGKDTGKIPDIKLPGIDPGDIKLSGETPDITDIIKIPITLPEIFKINDTAYYENYFGTILTTDAGRLATPSKTYQWGVTNDKDMSLQYFTFFLKPDGKYEKFRASFFLDSSAKADLVMNLRKETKDGMVLKSLTLKPGETLENVTVDIGGVNKLCIESEIRINHGVVKKIVVGEPVFINSNINP